MATGIYERTPEMKTGKYARTKYHKEISKKSNVGKHNSPLTEFKKGDKRLLGKKNNFWKDGRCQNKEYVSWLKQKRNRMKKVSEGTHTFGEWELLKKQYGYTCPACEKSEPEIKLTEDHIIPLSKGGSDYIENIQPLCQSCNSKKYTKIIFYGKTI